MSELWSPLVAKLQPYVPGEQPKIANLIKLNTNENPYGPSPKAIAAMQQALNADLRLYPDPDSSALKQAAADYYAVDASQVFVGNGSDEVLAHAFQAFFKQSKPLEFPDISYSFYPVYCGLYEIPFQTVALNKYLEIDVKDFSAASGGIIFPNPNAPTGRLLALEAIEQILQAHPHKVVVVDEAYIDFGGETAISLINRYANLVVIQTLSKSRSLAGLRVGLAFAQADLIAALERVKNSFNSYPLDRVALAGAVAAFEDTEYFERSCNQVIDVRHDLINNLEQLGFEVLPSAANFVFAYHKGRDAEILAKALRDKGIIVRHFKQPRIDQFLRISVGTEEQIKALIAGLVEIFADV